MSKKCYCDMCHKETGYTHSSKCVALHGDSGDYPGIKFDLCDECFEIISSFLNLLFKR